MHLHVKQKRSVNYSTPHYSFSISNAQISFLRVNVPTVCGSARECGESAVAATIKGLNGPVYTASVCNGDSVPQERKMSGKQPDQSTEWSPWIWSEEHNCNYSTRYGPTGEVEYDFQQPSPQDPRTPQHITDWDTEDTGEGANASTYNQAQYADIAGSSSSNVGDSSWEVAANYSHSASAGTGDITNQMDTLTIQGMFSSCNIEIKSHGC